MWFMDLQGPQDPVRDPQGQNCFHNNVKVLLLVFFTVLTYLLMVQEQRWTVGTGAVASARIKAVGPNWARNHCFLHCHPHMVSFLKCQFHLKVCLVRPKKNINFIKPWPLSNVFRIFTVTKWEAQKALLLNTKACRLSQGKTLVWLSFTLT